MEVRRYYFKEEEPQKIAHIGDIHVGIKDSDLDCAERAFEMVETNNMWMVGMGDYCEYREPSHKYYDREQSTMTIDEQLNWLFKNLNKVGRRKLGLLIGNHEGRSIKKMTLNPIKDYCERTNTDYYGMMAKLAFVFPSGKEYTMLVHHGYGDSRTSGGKVTSLTNFVKSHDVDSVVIGHGHALFDWVETELLYPGDRIRHRYKMCGMSGTFLRTYTQGASGYSEERMYEPVPLGFLITNIDPMKGISMQKVLF
jgi:predicted phosphodiesterase